MMMILAGAGFAGHERDARASAGKAEKIGY